MNFFVQFLRAIAFLVRDPLLLLGLIATAFFSLYCIAKACGLSGAVGADSGFGIALVLAHLVTIAANLVSHLLTLSCLAITTTPRSKYAPKACELPPGKPSAQSFEQESMSAAP